MSQRSLKTELVEERQQISSLQRICYLLAVALLLFLGSAAFSRNYYYQDRIKLWQDVVAKSPNKARSYNGLGRAYDSYSMTYKAMEQYLMALSLDPDYADAHLNLGITCISLGETGMAREELEKALQLRPNDRLAQALLNYIDNQNKF